MKIVLLLFIVWITALAPSIWRKIMSMQAESEVGRFSNGIRRLGYLTAPQEMRYKMSPNGYFAPSSSVEHMRSSRVSANTTHSSKGRRYQETKAKASSLRQRRQRILLRISLITVGSFFFGLIPVLSFLLDISLASFLLLIAYVGALAWLQYRKVNQLRLSQQRYTHASFARESVGYLSDNEVTYATPGNVVPFAEARQGIMNKREAASMLSQALSQVGNNQQLSLEDQDEQYEEEEFVAVAGGDRHSSVYNDMSYNAWAVPSRASRVQRSQQSIDNSIASTGYQAVRPMLRRPAFRIIDAPEQRSK